MKEFEKRWNCGMLSGSPSVLDSGANAKEAARFIWRAALEWVLDDLKAARDGFDLGLYDTLKKELNNE